MRKVQNVLFTKAQRSEMTSYIYCHKLKPYCIYLYILIMWDCVIMTINVNDTLFCCCIDYN